MAITEKDVFETADALLQSGQRPTIERVRATLGRGSPNTVNRFLENWWSSLSRRMQTSERSQSLSQSIQVACQSIYEQVRIEAIKDAETGLETTRRQLDADRQALQADRERLAIERAAMAEPLADLRRQLEASIVAGVSADMRIVELTAELEAARRQASEANVAADAARDERQRAAATAVAELTRLQDRADGNEKHWLKQLDTARDEIRDLKASTARLEKDLAGAKAQTTAEREKRIAAEAEVKAINGRQPARSPGRMNVRRKATRTR